MRTIRQYALAGFLAAACAATDFSAWTNYLEVTIQHEAMHADDTGTPVRLDLSQLSGGHDLFTIAQTDGDDLRASETDGVTELHVELASYDNTAETGDLWVRVNPDDDTDVVVRIYYGNALASAYATPESVWAGWSWVYHMEESSGSLIDQSANGWDASTNGGLPDSQSGKVGNAQDFDGSGDYAQADSATHDLNDYTLMLWHYRPTGAGGYDTMISGDNSWRYQLTSNSDQVGWGQRQDSESNQTVYPDTDWSLDTWQHRTMTRSGDSVSWYLDGVANGTDTLTIEQSYTRIQIGRNDAYGGADDFQGKLDEIFLYDGILSAGTIRTMYESMGDPASFAEYGPNKTNGSDDTPRGSAILFFH